MNNVTIGIAIPCYKGHLDKLKLLLESIEKQTVKPSEVVVSCSSVSEIEGLKCKIEALNFPLNIIYSSQNKNAAENRNIAALNLSTDIITFMDADDIMHPQRIEIIHKCFTENPQATMMMHGFNHGYNKDFEIYDINDIVFESNCIFASPDEQICHISRHHFEDIHNSQVSVRRFVFGGHLRFREEEEFHRKEDTQFNIDILRSGGTIIYCPARLSKYEVSGTQFVSDKQPIIVSAYYKIPNKFNHEFYIENIKRFFKFLFPKKIIFFCSQEVHREINSLIENKYLTNTEFIIKEFESLPKLTKFPLSFWEKHMELDEEKYHSPELGIIWASKEEFIKEASLHYPDHNWFFWLDAGCIRTDRWQTYCEKLFDRNFPMDPGVYVEELNPIPKDQEIFRYVRGNYYIAGGLILCHRDYIDALINEYDLTLMKYDHYNITVIDDQYILLSIINNTKNNWFHTIRFYELPIEKQIECPDQWMFLLIYL